MKNYLVLWLVLLVSNFSCIKENSTSTLVEERVEVQFDFQTGFEDNSVSVKIDDKHYFNAILNSVVSFAGPQASFTTQLFKGDYKLHIQRHHITAQFGDSKLDSTLMSIGTADKYWVGFSVYSDSLYIVIQDSSFFYL